MDRRDVLRILLGVPAAVALAGCGETRPAQPTSPADALAGKAVTVRYDSYNFGAPGIGGKGTQQLIDEFQALYPAITVQGRNVASTDILKSTIAQTAAGDPPAIAQIPLNAIDFAVSNLPLQAIDRIAPPAEYAEMVKHILPQALKLGQLNGHLYGSPYTFSTPTLFYNADIFKAAGLDPDQPPTTWEQVRQYGQQIKARTGEAPLNAVSFPNDDWPYQSYLNSNGASTLSTDKTRATFNQAAAIEVHEFFQGLVSDGIYPNLSVNDVRAAMSAGNMAMQISSTVLLPTYSAAAQGKWDLRTAGEPSFGDKPVVPINSGSGLFVLASDPLTQYGAWEFLRFAASQRGNTIITSVIGYVPQRDDVIDDSTYLKPFLDKEPRMLPTIRQLKNLQPYLSWPGKNATQALDVYMQAIQSVLFHAEDAQPTMDSAAARVDALLADG